MSGAVIHIHALDIQNAWYTTSMPQPVIETKNLTKFYGKSKGVENVELKVQEGEIFGFLGPNGAGKTTTIRLLLRLIVPTSGEAFLFGKDVQKNYPEILRDVGYLPGELNLYNGMTGNQMISFFGAFFANGGGAFRDELIQRLGCQMDVKFRTLSTGNKRKIGILLALFHRPRLLILDEPTIGLDPITQNELYRILFEMKESGTTIFFSSHNLPEVERVCDRVGIVKDGSIVDVERVEEMKQHRKKEIHVQFASSNVDMSPLLAIQGIEVVEQKKDAMHFFADGEHMDDVIRALSGIEVRDINIAYPDLEHVFLTYYER